MRPTASYDYARLVAAFGIVLFHAGAPGAAVGYAALPFFLMLMILMGWSSAERSGLGAYMTGRAGRLLWPWLIWSGLYGGLKLLEVALTGQPLTSEFAPHMLLTGPALHLWFLPFAFVACLAIWPVVRLARKQPAALVAPAVCLCLALILHGARQGQVLPAPLAQWAYVAPAVCLGLALALMRHSPVRQAGLICAFAAVAGIAGWQAGLMQIILAASAVVLCGRIHLPPSRLSAQAAAASMGVYLAHPLMFSLLDRLTPMAKTSLLFASLATAAALLLSLAQMHLVRRHVLWPGLNTGATNRNTIASEPS